MLLNLGTGQQVHEFPQQTDDVGVGNLSQVQVIDDGVVFLVQHDPVVVGQNVRQGYGDLVLGLQNLQFDRMVGGGVGGLTVSLDGSRDSDADQPEVHPQRAEKRRIFGPACTHAFSTHSLALQFVCALFGGFPGGQRKGFTQQDA